MYKKIAAKLRHSTIFITNTRRRSEQKQELTTKRQLQELEEREVVTVGMGAEEEVGTSRRWVDHKNKCILEYWITCSHLYNL